jgi:hypothetical protein
MTSSKQLKAAEKKEYRANRKAGWRGQGEYPNPVIGESDIEHHAPNTRKERRKVEVHGQAGRDNRG